MQFTNEIIRKLRERSKDKVIFDSLYGIVNFLNKSDVDILTIGSCAVFSHFNFIHRIPNDIDLVLSSMHFERVRESLQSDFKLLEKTGYFEFFIGKFKCHIVIDSLKIIDYENHKAFYEINLSLPQEFKCEKNISSRFYNRSIKIETPVIEICFILNMLGPINTNTIEDAIKIILKYPLNSTIISSFVDLQKDSDVLLTMVDERIAQMISIIKRSNNKNDIEAMDRMLELAESLKL